MDDKLRGYESLIAIGGVNFLLGMTWNTEQQRHPILFKIKLKSIAQKSGMHYGVSTSLGSNAIEKMESFQFSLCHEPDIDDDKDNISGAQFIAENVHKWTKKEVGKTSVFIKRLDDLSNGFGEENYWVTVTSDKGQIIGEFDTIIKDRFSLISLLEDIAITEDIVFSILDTDAELRKEINTYAQRMAIPDDELVIYTIEQPVFDNAARKHSNKISVIYKPSKIKIKKIGVVAAFITVSTTLFMAFSYITQIESILSLGDSQLSEKMQIKESQYSKLMREFKPSSQWTPEVYRKTTLESFIGDMKYNLYSPLNTSLILREINRTFPKYASEWEMSKITYVDNKFLVFYERIQESKGVYFLLDSEIEMHQKYSKGLDVKPYTLKDEGNTRVYLVLPKMPLNAQFESEVMLEQLRKESKIESFYKRAVKDVKDSSSRINDIIRRYYNLTFQDKWINMSVNELGETLAVEMKNFERKEIKTQRLEKDMNELEPLFLDETLILGNVMDFVTMMQLDSLFKWSYPKMVKTYPNASILEEKNKASNKKRKNKSSRRDPKKEKRMLFNDMYGPAIESYIVQISTQESEEEGKLKSYGMSDMIQLGVLLNKPFIHVFAVEYDKKSDQWVFIIHFNRKTEEYNQRIVAKENKDV
jgi:hypothetical protein